jgi:tetratricopeptide (TPR) repeat protein
VDTAASDLRQELLRLAEADPARLIAMATEVAARARAGGDLALASVAERAMGNAALYLENPDSAIRHLRCSMRLAARAESDELATEAQIRLAFALNARGRSREALREIEVALAGAKGMVRVHAEAQRGAIVEQLGRFDDALACFATAIPVLRRAGDGLWLHRTLSNRAVLHGYRHEFTAAESDLREAESVCRKLDLGLSLAFVQQNLGWLSGVRGDVPTALHYLDLAERRFRELGSQLGEVLTDRSQLLLSVGLTAEALQAAAQAVAACEDERREIGLPEARLLLSRAAGLQGDHDRAQREAAPAAREFIRQHRPQWAVLAQFVILRSRLAGQQRSQVPVGRLERAADDLAGAGWAEIAVEARLLAAGLALDRRQAQRGRRQLELAAQARRRGPAALRARGWYAEALLRLTGGNRRGAITAVRAALRILDEHRTTLGATDLRAHAAQHRVQLAELGLRTALRGGRPRDVLAWAEQGRASHLLMQPARPPDDPHLASSLSDLRLTVREIQREQLAGHGIAPLVGRQIALERSIRDYCRRRTAAPAPATAPAPAIAVESLAVTLGETALVEFVHLDGTLHAVTVVDGRTRLHHLGPLPPIRDLIERIPFALQRLARLRTSPESRSAATAMLRHAARSLDDFLFAPIASVVGDRPVVLIPTGPLQSLPWSILPSRTGRAVSVCPSAALWHAGRVAGARHQAGEASAARRKAHVVVAAGPDLPGAHSEAEAVAALYDTRPLTGPGATVAAVMAGTEGAEVAHLAAHGHLHPSNPQFSSLQFADGPLTVYDLEQLRHPPQLVVIASCDSGRSQVRAGDELLGLSATFLALGSRQIIASVVPVPDVETTLLMIDLHKLLLAGVSAADALAQVQAGQLMAGYDVAAATAVGFVSLGADRTLSAAGQERNLAR